MIAARTSSSEGENFISTSIEESKGFLLSDTSFFLNRTDTFYSDLFSNTSGNNFDCISPRVIPGTKRSRPKHLCERDRAALIRRLSDIIVFCQSKSIGPIDTLLSTLQDASFTLQPAHQRKKLKPRSEDCLQLLRLRQSTLIKNKHLCQALSMLTSMYTLYNRCLCSTEAMIMEAILERRDLQVAYDNIEAFCHVLVSPNCLSLNNNIFSRVIPLVSSILKQSCAPSIHSGASSSSLAKVFCHHCGHSFSEQSIQSTICEACGFFQTFDETASDTELHLKDAFASGRHFVENYALYRHLSVSSKGQKRLKNSILFSVKCLCKKLNIISDTDILNVTQTVVQYAQSGRTARMPVIIAACAFIVLTKNNEPVSVAEVANPLKIHTSTLLATVLRVARTLGIHTLPSRNYLELLPISIRRLHEGIQAANVYSETNISQSCSSATDQERRNVSHHLSSSTFPSLTSTAQDLLTSSDNEAYDSYSIAPPSNPIQKIPSFQGQSQDMLSDILNALDEYNKLHKTFKKNSSTEVSELFKKSSKASPEPSWDFLLSSSSRTIIHSVETLFKIYQASFSRLEPYSSYNCSLGCEFDRANVTSISGRGQYILASAIYYTLQYYKISITTKHIAQTFKLNCGTFNRIRSEFIAQLNRLLISIGILLQVNRLTPYETRRLVIHTALSNLSVLKACFNSTLF